MLEMTRVGSDGEVVIKEGCEWAIIKKKILVVSWVQRLERESGVKSGTKRKSDGDER